MNIYFSGIGGVGIGPLAEIAHDAGYTVVGSDSSESPMTITLQDRGVIITNNQDGAFLRQQHAANPIDWFVYTAALPANHPELVLARELGIRTAKRDELLAHIITEKNLRLIAVAGTHGKTTTTGMLLWTLLQRGVRVSYSIGTTLSWASSGHFDPESRYFVYECDEFDKNFLHFHPSISIITSVDYDHPDTYPTKEDYESAFDQFCQQSDLVIGWNTDLSMEGVGERTTMHIINKATTDLSQIHLAGTHNRENAYLVYIMLTEHFHDPKEDILHLLETFPGTGRRFERLAEGLYSDYGHHPSEIKATLQLAKEAAADNPVALIYQPHQNVRQHQIKDLYTPDIFQDTSLVYWVPTYLSREDPNLEVLTTAQLTAQLPDTAARPANLDDDLWQTITDLRNNGHLVLLMGAGDIDPWARRQLK